MQLSERLGIPLVRVKTLLNKRGVDLNSLQFFFSFPFNLLVELFEFFFPILTLPTQLFLDFILYSAKSFACCCYCRFVKSVFLIPTKRRKQK